MSKYKFDRQTKIATAIAFAMALGPLTALSFGTRHAGEETWERAFAGLDASQPSNPYAAYDSTAHVPAYVWEKTLMDIAAGAGMFERFETAVKAAGLDDLLASDASYTVFLPTNEAFGRMSEERLAATLGDPAELREFVESHIVPGRVSATDLMRVGAVQTINGKTLPLKLAENPLVGDAEIVKTENARNGVVHIVDAVL
jgi:uncharacterized surface protein with fasciclin (FAS1) repeats